jgi:hypothetical protein
MVGVDRIMAAADSTVTLRRRRTSTTAAVSPRFIYSKNESTTANAVLDNDDDSVAR